MSFPRDAYPYTNFHELNLGYFIVHFREIFSKWADLYDQMLNWKDATDEELATWKAGVEADLDQRAAALRAELETWKAQTGQDIAGWEDATLVALTEWQTATQAVFEAIRVEAAGSASAAAASAGDAATAKTAAETAQAAAEAAAASVQASAAQITTNTEDIADLKTQLIPLGFLNVTLLLSGDDLFTKTRGVYYANSSALAQSIVNKPTTVTKPFRAVIFNTSASSNRNAIILCSINNELWFNIQNADGYQTWKEIASIADIDTKISASETILNGNILNIANNLEKTNAENNARFIFEDEKRIRTINLLDLSTLTTGKILVNNVPTDQENYWYSDYIYIGKNTIYYRDHGASVPYLVSCYDANKNYLGAVAYTSETGYERITNATPTAYYKITPRQGTVYIRVNGRYTSNLMLCPYFYPEKFVKFGEEYYKGTLKIAMFGDSITLGTNGDDHSTPATENLAYWVEKITGYLVTNYGVGSMGWVSTQYLSEIAYDKISTTDLSSYDIVTLCFGVNDTGAVLGTFDSTDESTIMGQINKCVKYIGAQNPKARIIIIGPWNGASSNATFPKWGYGRLVYYAATGDTSRTKTRGDLGNAEKELCEVYGIGYISQADSPLNGFGLGQIDGTTPGPYIGADLVHPSLDGYKAMGEWLSAKITEIVKFK